MHLAGEAIWAGCCGGQEIFPSLGALTLMLQGSGCKGCALGFKTIRIRGIHLSDFGNREQVKKQILRLSMHKKEWVWSIFEH